MGFTNKWIQRPGLGWDQIWSCSAPNTRFMPTLVMHNVIKATITVHGIKLAVLTDLQAACSRPSDSVFNHIASSMFSL